MSAIGKFIFMNLTFLLLQVNLNCNAQFHERIYFNNLYNQNTMSVGKSILESDSSYIIAGGGLDSIFGYKNIIIAKISLDGELISWNEYRTNLSDHYAGFPGSIHAFNGSFILGGSHNVQNESCGLYMNFDSSFDSYTYNSYCSKVGPVLYFRYCNIINQHDLIFTGYDRHPDMIGKVLLLKSDSSGNEKWRTGYSFDQTSEGQKVIPTEDSGFIISGYSYNPGDDYSGNAIIIKTDTGGSIQWHRTAGHPEYMDGYGSVTIAPDGNFVFGYAHAVSQGPPYPVPYSYCKIKFIKYDQNGDTIWEKLYGKPYQLNMLRNIITLHDGSFVAVGYANSDTLTGPMQGWLFKINQYGDSIWYRDYRHYQEPSILDYLYDVYETSDHGLIACGESSRAEPGPDAVQRMWVLKLDSAGCAEPGCDSTVWIDETGGGEAWMRGELEVWPNPASGIVDCRWSMVDFRRDLSLRIYDVFGREVAEIKVPGKQDQVQINVESYHPGVYIAVLRNGGDFWGSGKFVVAR